MTNTRTFKT